MSYCQTYNKSVVKGHGTLIGNWMEEEVLRDASGHTHLQSSRHLDTFMRVMGERPYPVSETFVTSAGRRSRPPGRQTNERVEPTRHELASRRMDELASYVRDSCMFRAKAIDAAALEVALKERSENLESLVHTMANQHAMETETSANYKVHAPDSKAAELLTPEEKARRYFEQQVNVTTPEAGELISRWTELAQVPSSTVQQTPHSGRTTFAKDSFFSLPVQCSLRGLCKDSEALELLEQSLKGKRETHATATQATLPALQAFKQRLRDAITNAKGCLGFVILKAILKELCDERGLIPSESVEQFLWDGFDVRSADIPVEHLRSALKILTLADKTSLRASDFVEFLWAPLEPCRRSILESFQRGATSSKDIVAPGSNVATLRITHPRPQIRIDSIPDFLHPFLSDMHSKESDSSPVALPLVLEALADLSQGVPDDATFLAMVSKIAEKEGIKL